LVAAETRGALFKARDTVIKEQLAALAISRKPGRGDVGELMDQQ
jgi:hypothetical protein